MESIKQSSGSRLARVKVKIPWGVFLFLTAVFFMIHHRLFYVPDHQTVAMATADEVWRGTIEGNLVLRLGMILLTLFGIIALLWNKVRRVRKAGFLCWLLLFYICWAFLSLIWTINVGMTFKGLLNLVGLSLSALAVSRLFSLKDLILFSFFITGTYLTIGIIAEVAFGAFIPLEQTYRFAGTLHPNHQAMNCAILFLSSIFLSKTAKNDSRNLFIAGAVIALTFLILTKSRASFASALLALSAFWVLSWSKGRLAGFILGITCALSLTLLIFGADIFGSVVKGGVLLGRDDPEGTYTLTGRIPLWKECFQYIAERPLHGYGYYSFWTLKHLIDTEKRLGWAVLHAHSQYIQFFLDIGLVGMTIFILIVILGIRKSIKNYHVFGDIGYAFCFAVLLFVAWFGLLEEIIIKPSEITFLFMVTILYLAFESPPNGDAVGRSGLLVFQKSELIKDG